MFLRRFFDEPLAQASWMLGCTRTRAAIVIDPNRDAQQYLAAAADEGVTVTHVTETHIHADFLSGALELATRTGAQLLLSDEGGEGWKYVFAERATARLLHDGDCIHVGDIRIDVLHTPGHTPEHLSFLVTDTAGADRPMGICTGDFVFVGDVGRPDLLERAANVAGTMETSARRLFASIQRIKTLPDFLQLWPGHGAGSACGKALGAMPQSTLGYEKLFNWAFAVGDEDEFVQQVLAGQPDPPPYFARMKRINKEGPPLLGVPRTPAEEAAGGIRDALARGDVVLDLRAAPAFAAGHVPGTINIPLAKSFTGWAGWLVPYDRDVHLVAAHEADAARAARDLAMIGIDRVAGWFPLEALESWTASGGALDTIAQLTADELRARLRSADVVVLDVRSSAEWHAGHIPGVRNIPVGTLPLHVAELPANRPIVLHCQGGTRSAIAASILQSHGRRVLNYPGGFAEWVGLGMPVERE